jgi:hypothetical protein
MGKVNATWLDGDTNFDGLVTTDDYAGVDGALGAGNGTEAGGPQLIGVGSNVGSGLGTVVPEPGTLSLLAIGAMGHIGRRKRRD